LKKVSVIIPAYNSEDFIEEAIESVLSQSHPIHELIVVNDGSCDRTSSIARSFGEQVYVIDSQNGGVSAARNQGAQHATGEWICFLDADDILVPTAIQNLLDLTDEDNYGVVYGGVIQFDASSGKKWPRGGGNSAGLPPFPAKANFKRALIVTPGAAIVRADLHRRIGGFDKHLQLAEDRNYWMKLGVITGFRFCDNIVMEKRSHDSQASSRYDEALNSGLIVQLDFLIWLENWGHDKSFLESNPKKIAHQAIRKALKKRRWHSLNLMLHTLHGRGITSLYISFIRAVSLIFPVFKKGNIQQ